jgi:hypothetical protein
VVESPVGRPVERYGVRGAGPRRTVVAVTAVVLAVVFGAWLGWAAWHHSHPDVAGRVESFHVVSEHEVELTLDIVRSGGFAVECVIRAQADDHSVVGEATISLEAGADREVSVTPTMRTDRRASSVSLVRCERV